MKRKSNTHNSLALLFLFVLVTSSFCLSSLAEGDNPSALEIKCKILVTESNNSKSSSYTFDVRCITSQTNWFIESHAALNAIEYYYFNGTNTYSTFEYTQDDTNNITEGIATGRRPNLPSHIKVVPFEHPLHSIGVNVPWMAFCSSHYLKQKDRLIPLPGPVFIQFSPFAFGYEDHCNQYQDDLGLPINIKLYSSDKLMKASVTNSFFLSDRRFNPIRSGAITNYPMNDRQLACHYEVNASTNVNGWNIPLKFNLVVYPHMIERSIRQFEASGVTTSIIPISSVPDLNIQKGTYVVTDRRFRSKQNILDSITYNITNKQNTNISVIPETINTNIQGININRLIK